MLILLKNLSPADQAKCQQNGWVALDPKTGATMHKSKENCGANNRPAQYFLYVPHIMVIVIWAKTDEEALEVANGGGI
jgi:ABC-type proline/glycine betaine transport system substrate-binding protein